MADNVTAEPNAPGGDGVPHDVSWQQYTLYIDLYKFYIDVLIRFNVFSFAITGGLLGYVLAHSDLEPLRLALVLPAVLSLGVIVFLVISFRPVRVLDRQTSVLRQELNLPARPSHAPLKGLVVLFTILHVLTLAGLILLIAVPSYPPVPPVKPAG